MSFVNLTLESLIQSKIAFPLFCPIDGLKKKKFQEYSLSVSIAIINTDLQI